MNKIKNLIIQVARLDRNYNQELLFSYQTDEGKKLDGKYTLTSLFWKDKVLAEQKEETEILFIVPISLPIQNVENSSDEYLTKVNNINTIDYLQTPDPIIKEHPHIKDNKYLIVNSIGKFIKKDKQTQKTQTFHFQSKLEDITIQILSKLLVDYVDVEKVYVDVSSGHNIYITAMLNAINKFIPISNIFNGLKNNLNVFTIFSDPITNPNEIKEFSIHKSEINAKFFFEIPYKIKKGNDLNDITKIIRYILQPTSNSHQENLINDFFELYFQILFYSIKNGYVILLFNEVLFDFYKEFYKNYPAESLIMQVNKYTSYKNILELNQNSISSHEEEIKINLKLTKVKFSALINYLFTCSFYNTFYNKLYKNLNHSPNYYCKITKNDITKKNDFKYLYILNENELDLCSQNENNFLKSFFEEVNLKNVYEKFLYELKKLIDDEIDPSKLSSRNFTNDVFPDKQHINKAFNARNFVAHYGLEKNSVLFKIENKSDNNSTIQITLVDDIKNNFKYIIAEINKTT